MLPNCSQCYKEINDTVCMAMGRRFHVDCFRCSACRTALADQEFRLGPGPELEVRVALFGYDRANLMTVIN